MLPVINKTKQQTIRIKPKTTLPAIWQQAIRRMSPERKLREDADN
jgi:hypothetical protein